MKFRMKLLGGAVVAALCLGVALAQSVFPTQTSVVGTELIANALNATGAYFSTSQINTYIRAQMVTTPVTVAQGGTGLASGTSGGVLGYTASGTLASSAALAANAPVIGGGAGATPTTITAGTTGQLLQGGSTAPSFSTSLSGAYNFVATLIAYGNSAGAPTHISTQQTTAPALTSCGTGSPAITGTDTAGIVTMGTSATGCVITFNVAYTGTPYCVVSWIATPLASQSYVTANTAITITQTSTSGNKLQYVCLATAGG